jgi:enamine deaminase RidA (YjgF/YER057c/UK114 family)
METRRIEVGTRMSQAVVHHGVAYLSGQVALDAPGKSVTEQTKSILGRIAELLEQAGSSKSRLLSATIWLSDISTFNEMNAVWDQWLVPNTAPARATVEARLAAPEYTVEISVIAAL